MPTICPAILASTENEYKEQIEKIASFAHRIQIDLTDGDFAKPKTIEPEDCWWPVGVKADVHLMYKKPLEAAQTVIKHSPHMIIAHAEAEADFHVLARACREHDVKIGLALLPHTQVSTIGSVIEEVDHVMIFSGQLGVYNSFANLSLLDKARQIRELKPDMEIGWDGGANTYNISQIIFGGIDVVNVGGFIQESQDPHKAYSTLKRIAEETGTT